MTCRRWAPRFPGVLLAMVGSIVVVTALDLTSKRGPPWSVCCRKGSPTPSFPSVPASDLLPLFAGAVGIAFVSLADTSATSQAFAARNGYTVDPNQELIGVGAANVAAGLLQGFPVSSSASRTAVAEQSGAKSEVTGLVGAALIGARLLFAPALVQDLPSSVLAAIVIVAATSLVEIGQLKTLLRVRRRDFRAVDRLQPRCDALRGAVGHRGRGRLVTSLTSCGAHEPGSTRSSDGSRGGRVTTTAPGTRRPVRCPDCSCTGSTRRCSSRTRTSSGPTCDTSCGTRRHPSRGSRVAAEPITDVDTTAAEMLWELDEDLEHRGSKSWRSPR